VQPAGRGGLVALDFDHADITAVVQTVSEIVGFNYILAPDVQGTVTVRTLGQISRGDLFDVFRAILDVHGFTAIQAGDLYKIVRRDGARARAVPTVVGSFTDRTRPGDEIIMQIVPVPSAAVAELVGLLQPLISKDGQLIARPDERLLVIVDTASNVARLLDVISRVDRETLGDGIHVIPVHFADAAALATILNQRALRLAGAGSGGSPALVIAEGSTSACPPAGSSSISPSTPGRSSWRRRSPPFTARPRAERAGRRPRIQAVPVSRYGSSRTRRPTA
jgi:type II secretory pathway component GspD/PulD (secretin)